MKEYTDKELIEVGRKTIEARWKQAEKDRENRRLMSQLFKAYKEGKIKLPKA